MQSQESNEKTLEWLSSQNFALNTNKDLLENIQQNFTDRFDNNLLHYATKAGNWALITQLIEVKSFDINSSNRRGETALHLAAKFVHDDNLEIVAYLLAHKADIEAVDFKAQTPIFHAIFAANTTVINFLLDNGTNIHHNDNSRKASILHYAALMGNLDLVRHLIEVQKMCAWLRDSGNETSLLYAARRNQLEVFKYLLELVDLDISYTSHRSETPLTVAIQHNAMDIVRYLVEVHAADIKERVGMGMCSLHIACKFNHFRIVKYLLSRDKSVINARDRGGKTPLHYAAEFADVEVLKLLIENGANPNIFDRYKLSTLYFAVIGDNLVNVKYLVEVHKLDAEVVLFDAARLKRVDILKYFLEEKKLNAFVRCKDKRSLLHVAYCIEIVKYLVEVHKLDVNAIDKFHLTPLDIAEKNVRNYLRAVAGF